MKEVNIVAQFKDGNLIEGTSENFISRYCTFSFTYYVWRNCRNKYGKLDNKLCKNIKNNIGNTIRNEVRRVILKLCFFTTCAKPLLCKKEKKRY